jgi:DUF1009 family protein
MTNMTREIPDKIAIIAGQGLLPRELYNASINLGVETYILGLEDQIDIDLFEGINVDIVPIHSVSQIIKKIRSRDINNIVFGGRVKRAAIPKLILDLKGAKLFASIIRNGLGDSPLAKTIINFLEREGFKVLSPEVIAQSILSVEGNMTSTPIKKGHIKDIEQGHKMLNEICKLDVGQALVIQNGLILGVEAVEGTDELIRRCGSIRQKFDSDPVLVKICKPHQDKRIDMPCIGERTIRKMSEFGIGGIGLKAGSCLILNKAKTIEFANQCGIFIYGLQ